MKNKLILILSLLMMVIPFTGCGEQTDPNLIRTVTAKVVKEAGQTKSFRLDDCAKIASGTGEYVVGDRVIITVEYNANACDLRTIKVNGEVVNESSNVGSDNGVKRVEYSTIIQNNIDFEAHFGLSGHMSGGYTFKFVGVEKENTIQDSAEFPILDGSGSGSVKIENNGQIIKMSMGTTLTTALSVLAGYTVNPNYIYINKELVKSKVTWVRVKADTSTGACSFNENIESILESPDEHIPEPGNSYCYKAVISNDVETFKTQAIENMLMSELFISINKGTCILKSADGDSIVYQSIGPDCMYASRIKGLYKDIGVNGKDKPKVVYYEMQESSLYEDTYLFQGIVREKGKDASFTYYTCELQDKEIDENKFKRECKGNYNKVAHNVNVVDFKPSDTYGNLKINNLIKALGEKTETKTDSQGMTTTEIAYEIDISAIDFAYDPNIQDVVPTIIRTDKDEYTNEYANEYAMIYKQNLKDTNKDSNYEIVNVNTNDGFQAFDAKINPASTSDLYTVEISEDFNQDIKKIIENVTKGSYNLVYSRSAADAVPTKFREKLYISMEKLGMYDTYKMYMFTVAVTNDSIPIISILSVEDTDISKYADYKFVSDGTNSYYNDGNAKDLSKEILDLIAGKAEIIDIYKSDEGDIIYEIRGDHKITYKPKDDKFLLDEDEEEALVFKEKGEEVSAKVSQITYEISTIVGTLTQTAVIYDDRPTEITTELNAVQYTGGTATMEEIIGILNPDDPENAKFIELVEGKQYMLEYTKTGEGVQETKEYYSITKNKNGDKYELNYKSHLVKLDIEFSKSQPVA